MPTDNHSHYSSKISFTVSFFGQRLSGMILSCLFSIVRTHPKASIIVLWQDVSKETITALKRRFSKATFLETHFNLSSDPVLRVASKTLMWKLGIDESKSETTVFLDADVLIVKNIENVIENIQTDIIFTSKEDRYELNTGVVVVKNQEKGRVLFDEWQKRTIEIQSDKKLTVESVEKYGAPDQMSFAELSGFIPHQSNFQTRVGDFDILFKALPCEILNETKSKSITSKTHIIHYKGGWQPILLEGAPFTVRRTKVDSFEMYLFYLKTYKDALASISENEKLVFKDSIFIPLYLGSDLKENFLLYKLLRFKYLVMHPIQEIKATRLYRKLHLTLYKWLK